ncbi:Gfo/Idh/MocA family protein [Dongia sp. agr-C8]
MIKHALLIGSGSIGRRHLQVIRETLPQVLVTLLRQANPPELEASVVTQFDRVVSDFAAAISPKPDFAVIATPAPTHVGFARRLAEAGIPMLLEKPVSDTLTGCAELAAICKSGRLPVLVGYTLRYHPGFQALAERIAAGTIGRPLSVRAEVGQYLPDWRPGMDYRRSVSAQQALGGGALLELSHEIDLVRALFGMPVSVVASLDRLGDLEIDVEDTVEMVLHHNRGGARMIASIHLDLLQRPARRKFTVIGSEGTLELDFIAGQLMLHHRDGSRLIPFPAVAHRNQLYSAELTDLLAAMQSGHPTRVGLADGIETLQIIDAARESAASGKHILLSAA